MAEQFEPLYSAAEMRAAEERYPNYPDSIPELMERAGAAVAREAMLAFPAARSFACVCGGGSNGGDGRVAARVLREAGHSADETDDLTGCDVIVDALFGTGFRGELRPEAAELIARLHDAEAPIVSVDIPSGVDASTGEIAGVAVEADLTVTFHGSKVGLAVAPGRFSAGRVVVADIGLDDTATAVRRATRSLLDVIPRRSPGDTKYRAGAVLVVGGQQGMTGAACLTAMAALRADAGYVTLAVPESSLAAAEVIALEPVKLAWSDDDAVETIVAVAERATALALGPGLGRSAHRVALVRALLEQVDLPAVVDADALFALEPVARTAPTVLTPHVASPPIIVTSTVTFSPPFFTTISLMRLSSFCRSSHTSGERGWIVTAFRIAIRSFLSIGDWPSAHPERSLDRVCGGYGESSKAVGRVRSALGPETHCAESPKLLAVFQRLRLGGGRQSPRREGCARDRPGGPPKCVAK